MCLFIESKREKERVREKERERKKTVKERVKSRKRLGDDYPVINFYVSKR